MERRLHRPGRFSLAAADWKIVNAGGKGTSELRGFALPRFPRTIRDVMENAVTAPQTSVGQAAQLEQDSTRRSAWRRVPFQGRGSLERSRVERLHASGEGEPGGTNHSATVLQAALTACAPDISGLHDLAPTAHHGNLGSLGEWRLPSRLSLPFRPSSHGRRNPPDSHVIVDRDRVEPECGAKHPADDHMRRDHVGPFGERRAEALEDARDRNQAVGPRSGFRLQGGGREAPGARSIQPQPS